MNYNIIQMSHEILALGTDVEQLVTHKSHIESHKKCLSILMEERNNKKLVVDFVVIFHYFKTHILNKLSGLKASILDELLQNYTEIKLYNELDECDSYTKDKLTALIEKLAPLNMNIDDIADFNTMCKNKTFYLCNMKTECTIEYILKFQQKITTMPSTCILANYDIDKFTHFVLKSIS